MLLRMNPRRRRILMTVDAIGGVWQYALALAKQLVAAGDFVILAGLGPSPTSEQKRQAQSVAPARMAAHTARLDGHERRGA